MYWWSSVVSQGKEVANQRETAHCHADEPQECRVTISPGSSIWGFNSDNSTGCTFKDQIPPSAEQICFLYSEDLQTSTLKPVLMAGPSVLPSKFLLYCIIKWSNVTQTERYIHIQSTTSSKRLPWQSWGAGGSHKHQGTLTKLIGGVAARVLSELSDTTRGTPTKQHNTHNRVSEKNTLA